MRVTVAGGDNVKNRLHDILLQNGKDAVLSAGWELFFHPVKILRFLNFCRLFLSVIHQHKVETTSFFPQKYIILPKLFF